MSQTRLTVTKNGETSRWHTLIYESRYHTLKYLTDSYMFVHTTFNIEIYFVSFLLTDYIPEIGVEFGMYFLMEANIFSGV